MLSDRYLWTKLFPVLLSILSLKSLADPDTKYLVEVAAFNNFGEGVATYARAKTLQGIHLSFKLISFQFTVLRYSYIGNKNVNYIIRSRLFFLI